MYLVAITVLSSSTCFDQRHDSVVRQKTSQLQINCPSPTNVYGSMSFTERFLIPFAGGKEASSSATAALSGGSLVLQIDHTMSHKLK